MVNAGAIACSGLIREAEGDGAFEKVLDALGRFAGRRLGVDEAVYASEDATGHRNRAIAYLLRNHSVIKGDVDEVLEVYFRQCSILVTARDLSVMAATLANHGVNPVTGEKVISSYSVARALSVMTSSGMYDYAGEWVYRVGIPAKSGVGGGIMAALPAQFGLGTYSPLLDSHGNSVRGIRTCEALSAHFDLHVLNRSGDVRTCVIAEYGIDRISSRRTRQRHEEKILGEQQDKVRVLELVGAFGYETAEYLSRRLSLVAAQAQIVILDFRRVPTITRAAAQLLAESLDFLSAANVTAVLSGIQPSSLIAATLDPQIEKIPRVRKFALLDDAIEWTEDQIVFRHGGFVHLGEAVGLGEQALLADLPQQEMDALAGFMHARSFPPGERIISAGEPANSLYFLESGMVSVKLPSGVRVATLSAGTVVGEMALIDSHRSADVWADTHVQCRELPIEAYFRFRDQHPQIAERLARNLAGLLARRLVQANSRIELLTSH
jgi:glutaminase